MAKFSSVISDSMLIVHVAVWLMVARVLLHLFSFPKVYGVMTSRQSTANVEEKASGDYHRIVWAVAGVGRRILGKRPCLPSALVVHRMLSRIGLRNTLYIGVKKDGSDCLAAHAWVNLDGKVVIGGWRSPLLYRTILTIPHEGRVEKSDLSVAPYTPYGSASR